jgi:hypothetical protein
MRIDKLCASAIEAAGQTGYLLRNGERLPFTGSLQPVFHEREAEASPLGVGDTDRFTLYVPCEGAAMEIARDDCVMFNGRRFLVRRIETVRAGRVAAYRRAALRAVTPESGGGA